MAWTAIKGTTYSDLLLGSAKDEVLYGYQGNDTLLGGAGNDTLIADMTLFGGPGGFFYPGEPGYNLLKGGAGDDTLVGGSGWDALYGGPGNDVLYIFINSSSILNGQSGNDTLYWRESAIRLNGGRGRDTLVASSADLDLRNVPDGKLVDIEIIDISTSSAGNKLTLTRKDVLAISSTTDTLTVLGDGYASVDIVGQYRDLGISGSFHRYKLGAATLLVDTDIDVH